MKILSKHVLATKTLSASMEEAEQLLLREIAIMKKMDHPNVLSLHEVIEDKENSYLYLITDYMKLGYLGSPQHLKHLGTKPGHIGDDRLRVFFRECLSGLFYCKLELSSA